MKNRLTSFSIGVETDSMTGDIITVYTIRKGRTMHRRFYPGNASIRRIQGYIDYNPPGIRLEADDRSRKSVLNQRFDYINIELVRS